jgi:hypothetical protein
MLELVKVKQVQEEGIQLFYFSSEDDESKCDKLNFEWWEKHLIGKNHKKHGFCFRGMAKIRSETG